MEFINATRMMAGYTLGVDAAGRESLVVAIKGTFVLPVLGEPVQLHEVQVPLTMADTFTGEPGLSAPVHEADFALRKGMCDVLLLGSAYAPEGRAATRVTVEMEVGALRKTCDVLGDRVWNAGVTGIRPSLPEPFAMKPVSYDVAFGGVDDEAEDPAHHGAFEANPVGKGYRRHLKSAWVDGRPLPNTQEPSRPVQWPSDRYHPMAFGPVGRGWQQRARYAGTYDERWLENDFPFLPKDFDERYFQAAPPDQQIPFSAAPLMVTLRNFTSDGLRRFELPHFEAPVYVFPRKGSRQDLHATLDTIVFEPDEGRFTLTWRLTLPLKRNVFELSQVLVGKKGMAWWQQRERLSFPIPVVMVPVVRAVRASE